jgi:hypothetical protein
MRSSNRYTGEECEVAIDTQEKDDDTFNYSMQEYTNINIQIIYNEKYIT